MVDLMLTVAYFGILLGLGVLIANVMKKKRIPDTFFLLLLGLIMGQTLYMNPYVMYYVDVTLIDVSVMGEIPNFLRMLALIFVVFTGTFNLGFRAFKKFGNISINLAMVGVIFNTVILGIIAHFMFGMDIVVSLLLAAIISGTGTSVLFAFEDTLKGSKRALNILKVESIFNSPLSVLLPMIFLGLVAMESGALFQPMEYLSQFWLMLVAGVGTGLILGIAVSKFLKSMLEEYTALMLFAIAIMTYGLAEMVGGSGMLAVAICGLIAGDLTIHGKKEVRRFDDHLTDLLTISVFTLLGADVALTMGPYALLTAILFFLIVFFIRPVFLIPMLRRSRKSFDRRDIMLMSFVTPRGLSAAAMAPIVAAALLAAGQLEAVANQMVNIIFLVILLSILFSSVIAGFIGKFAHKEKQIRERDFLGKIEKETEHRKVKSEEEVLEEVEGK